MSSHGAGPRCPLLPKPALCVSRGSSLSPREAGRSAFSVSSSLEALTGVCSERWWQKQNLGPLSIATASQPRLPRPWALCEGSGPTTDCGPAVSWPSWAPLSARGSQRPQSMPGLPGHCSRCSPGGHLAGLCPALAWAPTVATCAQVLLSGLRGVELDPTVGGGLLDPSPHCPHAERVEALCLWEESLL